MRHASWRGKSGPPENQLSETIAPLHYFFKDGPFPLSVFHLRQIRTCPLAAQLTILPIGSFSGVTQEGPPGETFYPRETSEISSFGPKNKLLGVLSHACTESGLKSRLW